MKAVAASCSTEPRPAGTGVVERIGGARARKTMGKWVPVTTTPLKG